MFSALCLQYGQVVNLMLTERKKSLAAKEKKGIPLE
jgi:hypothetical protein